MPETTATLEIIEALEAGLYNIHVHTGDCGCGNCRDKAAAKAKIRSALALLRGEPDPTCVDCVPLSERDGRTSYGICLPHQVQAFERAGVAKGHPYLSGGQSGATPDAPARADFRHEGLLLDLLGPVHWDHEDDAAYEARSTAVAS